MWKWLRMHLLPAALSAGASCCSSSVPVGLCRTEEEDVEVAEDAKDLLTKIGVETSLR